VRAAGRGPPGPGTAPVTDPASGTAADGPRIGASTKDDLYRHGRAEGTLEATHEPRVLGARWRVHLQHGSL